MQPPSSRLAHAAYGGISAGKPNPTKAVGVKSALAALGISKPLINVPGCPIHPDWLVGTVSYFLVNGKAPALDSSGRPIEYFGKTVHMPVRISVPITRTLPVASDIQIAKAAFPVIQIGTMMFAALKFSANQAVCTPSTAREGRHFAIVPQEDGTVRQKARWV